MTEVVPNSGGFVGATGRVCSRCVMDESDPRIQFDSHGVCNHCRSFDLLRASRLEEGGAGRERFDKIVEQIKSAGRGREYDCVVGISGGVDSTYTCHVIARAGLRALAVHLDNGWNSELATHNIEQALKKLGMELFTYVIDWPEFKDLQLAFLRASTPDGELPTDHAIFALMMRVANEQRVRYVITGMNYATESTNVEDWTYSPSDWRYIRGVHRKFGSRPLRTYPHFSLPYLAYTFGLKRVKFVSPLNYLPYERSEAVRVLREELGWRDYGGKHHESIYTRFFQSYILPQKFGIDKRRAHLSDRIKIGHTTRAAALAELAQPPYDPELLEADRLYVIKKLGISEEEFASIMAAPRRTFRDYPNQDAVIRRLKRLQHWLRRRQVIPK